MSAGKSHRDEKPPRVMFEARAWITGTMRLTMSQEWTYLQISLACMETGRPVPADEIEFIMFRHSGDWRADLDVLIAKGKVEESAKGYAVRRAIDEHKAAARVVENRRKAGKKGGEISAQKQGAKKQRSSDAGGKAQARREEKRREEEPNGSIPPHSPPTDSKAVSKRIELPDSIDPDLWKDFKEHRRKLKSPMTHRAEELAISKLQRIESETGQAPNDVIRHAIERGWKGFFPIKDGDKGKSGWGWIND